MTEGLLRPEEMALLLINCLIDIRTALEWLVLATSCVAVATLGAAWVMYRNGQGSREVAKAMAKVQRDREMAKMDKAVGEIKTIFRG